METGSQVGDSLRGQACYPVFLAWVLLGCLGPSHLLQAAPFPVPLCPLREESDSLREAGPWGRGSATRFHGPHTAKCRPPPSHTLAHVDGGFAGLCEGDGRILPPGLSPPLGGGGELLGWPQTRSPDTHAGRAVCWSGRAALCGPARPRPLACQIGTGDAMAAG